MSKTGRIGIRIEPDKKAEYEAAAVAFGYKSLSAFTVAMLDWAIAYDQYNGDYAAFLKDKGYV